MLDFNKILPDTLLIQNDLLWCEGKPSQEHVIVGSIGSLPSIYVKKLMNAWCQRIDRILQLDFNTFGKHTWRSKEALKWRGITYDEFIDLYNEAIPKEDYIQYPIYDFLSIYTEVQRQHFILKYPKPNETAYVQVLEENGLKILLNFFLDKYKNLRLKIPYSMMDKHMYIFGGTGSGKSSLIRHMIHRIRDQFPRMAIILVDPHGDLAQKVYESSHNKDFTKIVNFDLDFHKQYTPCINPFDLPDREARTLRFASENIVGTFNEVLQADGKFSDPQKSMLQKCVDFILSRDNATMNMFLDLLRCKPYILKQAQKYDDFFADRFQKGRADTIREALLGKFEIFLDNKGLRPIISGKSTINLEECMENSKTILFNLGGLPDAISKPAFGKILITYIKNIATKRDTKKVVPCMLFIDECQNFVSDTYEVILSQMRKYGVWLVMANQYVNQLGKQVESVQRNTAIKIGSAEDSEDFKGIMKIPKSFLVQSDDSANKVDLKQYEFFIDVRFRGVTKFKSPSFLFKSKDYSLTKEELKALDKYQLEHYYKKLDEEPIIEEFEDDDVDLEMFDVPED